MTDESESNKGPIKRHDALKQLSREHHHGLLLCWKLREGFRKDISTKRIKKYTIHFWKKNLRHHFQLEEKHIFPILGDNHPLVKKALSQHRRLQRLFEDKADTSKSLSLIEEELELHIRFEERVLFNEIQQQATEQQLALIQEIHTDNNNCEDWKDEFWK